jgi:hypothetical protein
LLVEWKGNDTAESTDSAESAIDQIKRRRYPQRLEGFSGKLLLARINCDQKTNKGECVIELADKRASPTR